MKEIPLSRGFVTLVDDEDFEKFSKFSWYAATNRKTRTYAQRGARASEELGNNCVLLHREIMSAPEGVQVDHINGDCLDNRKENLRLASRGENMRAFRRPKTGMTSKYRGVLWNSKLEKWRARIGTDPNRIHLGYFTDETAAARAYDDAARKLFGEFAAPNFPHPFD